MGGAVHLRIVHLLSKYSIPAVVCEGLWYQYLTLLEIRMYIQV